MSREIRITPSILNADFSRLNEEIDSIAQVSDLLHLDVMDDIFVPNFTFDFAAASKIIEESSLEVDAHLMVADVDEIAIKYPEMMDKVRRTRKVIGDRPIWLQVDGGISMNTIEIALEAGADTFVVGSAVFSASDPAQMVVDIREFATSKVES